MHFIDAHRRAQRVAFAAFLQPRGVVPLELLGVPDNRGLLRRDLEEKTERIGVQLDVAVRVADLELVMRAPPHAGNENFPDPGSPEQAHGMKPPVPTIEIADHADALRIRRPDREARAVNAVNRAQLRAQLVVNLPLVALAKQEQVGFAQRGQKGISVARAPRLAALIRDDKIVGINGGRQLGDAFKNVRVGNAFERELGPVLFMHRLDFHLLGVGQQRADDEAGLVAERLHSEQRMWRLMGQVNQTAKFVGRQNHAATLTKRFPQGTIKKRLKRRFFVRRKTVLKKERGRTLLRPLQQHFKFSVGVTTSNVKSVTRPRSLACHQLWGQAGDKLGTAKIQRFRRISAICR